MLFFPEKTEPSAGAEGEGVGPDGLAAGGVPLATLVCAGVPVVRDSLGSGGWRVVMFEAVYAVTFPWETDASMVSLGLLRET